MSIINSLYSILILLILAITYYIYTLLIKDILYIIGIYL